ncbi:MAG: hypothetical protein ACK5WZ_09720, partial [Pseudobdellovibrionaceae bacterium]
SLICPQPPASGFFELESRSPSKWIFQKRKNRNIATKEVPYDRIIFHYNSIEHFCDRQIPKDTVVTGTEIDLLTKACHSSNWAANANWLPSARFGILRFNPNSSLFNLSEARKFFAEEVRKKISSTYPKLTVEKSLFPKLLPGFLESSEFRNSSFQGKDFFKSKHLIVPKIEISGLSIIYESIILAAQGLQMNVEISPIDSSSTVIKSFLGGEFTVIAGASGFWAQDPVGDLQMWFTKNLHKTMTFVWADHDLYKQLNEIDVEKHENVRIARLENLNKYIFDQSIIAPVMHFRRFYLTRSSGKVYLSQSITSPAPWQIKIQE